MEPVMKPIMVKDANIAPVEPPKPIIKWVGGKTQIIDVLMRNFPVEMNNYHEIFLGGGSVLLALLEYASRGDIRIRGKIFAYDVNAPLVFVYKNLQRDVLGLYGEVQKLTAELSTCSGDVVASPMGEKAVVNRKPKTIEEALGSKESYYYWVRKQYNELAPEDKISPRGSAMFVFLNKTCFRGLFRMGKNGFNVPYGHYKNPEVANLAHWEMVSKLIQRVEFIACDFSVSLAGVYAGDYVYLDPPYAPETSTSFVGYTSDGFGLPEHKKLFGWCHETHVMFMMSNADVELVKDSFKDTKYAKCVVVCKRSINSKNPEAKTNELIIKNY